MPRAKRHPSFEEFYRRQVTLKELGPLGQRKLSESRIAIVGLGGLGTASALYLALAGVGHLRLIDQDTVQMENLHRQILYSSDDLLLPKAEVSAKALRRANPLVSVVPVAENLNAGNVERLLSDVDCVVDGLDNMSTRYLVNRACIRQNVPYIFGSAIGLEGHVSVFVPPETPCLECVFPSVKDDGLLTCDTRGVLGATPGIIGSMQAVEAVKVLANIGSPLKGKLLICDFNDMYFTVIDILRRNQCPACHKSTGLPLGKERLVWLCGEKTANVNPYEALELDLRVIRDLVKRHFKIRVKSRLALVFSFGRHEISLFSNGRMLIKNVADENEALTVYRDVVDKLGLVK